MRRTCNHERNQYVEFAAGRGVAIVTTEAPADEHLDPDVRSFDKTLAASQLQVLLGPRCGAPAGLVNPWTRAAQCIPAERAERAASHRRIPPGDVLL